MKIKIMTFLFILVVGLSCLGVDSDVAYAYTGDDIVSTSGSAYLGLGSERQYSYSYLSKYVLVLTSGGYSNCSYDILYYSNSPIYSFSIRENPHDGDLYTFCDVVFSESPLCYGHFIEHGVNRTDYYTYQSKITMSDGKEYYVTSEYCWRARPNSLTSDAIDYISYVDVGCVPQDIDEMFSVFFSNYDFPPKVFTYNPDLGYLNNLVRKSLVLTDSVGNQDMSSIKELISFDALSTSGVDLTSGEYSIRVYEQVCYYKGHSSEVFKDDYELVKIGDFPIDNSSISYLSSDAFNITTDNTELLSGWDIFWNNAVRSDNKYYQIIKTNDDGSLEYGGYVKLSCLPDGSGYYATTVTPEHDTDIENGGYIGDGVENGLGSGTNYGDAELDANESLSGNADSVISDVYGVDEFVTTMSGLAGMVGAFPMVLGALFGFLPSWCLALIASAFALLVALIIYKCVRG